MKDWSNPKLITSWIPETEEILISRGKEPELPLNRLSDLNKKIWGIHKRKMTVIGGRTSNCKSVLAINIAWDLACAGKRTYFISLEMPVTKIIERMFCLEHRVVNVDLLKGALNNDAKISFAWDTFKERVKKMPLVLSDMIGGSWQDIDEFMAMVVNKPEVVIIDHIQEIKSNGNKLEAIEEYLRKMRELAIRHNFALVICSQINRISQQEKDRRPQLHNLKGSGSIEEMADICILLHWEYHYDETKEKSMLELNVAKNRDGLTGVLPMKIIPEYSRIENYVHPEQVIRKPMMREAGDVIWEK